MVNLCLYVGKRLDAAQDVTQVLGVSVQAAGVLQVA
jgi:hypothetical protein